MILNIKPLILYIVFVIQFLVACTEHGSNSPEAIPDNATKFFPGKIGSNFLYRLDTLNIVGSYDSVGSRNTSFDNNEIYQFVNYVGANSKVVLLTETFNGKALYRTSERAVYLAVDTTFISGLIDNQIIYELGDILKYYSEINFFSTPIINNRYWIAFKISLIVEEFIEYSLLELLGIHKGIDILDVPFIDTPIEAYKVEYKLQITNPQDLNSKLEYSAFAWFAEDIGIVQMEGNSIIINVLTGFGIQLADTSKYQNQILQEFFLSN